MRFANEHGDTTTVDVSAIVTRCIEDSASCFEDFNKIFLPESLAQHRDLHVHGLTLGDVITTIS